MARNLHIMSKVMMNKQKRMLSLAKNYSFALCAFWSGIDIADASVKKRFELEKLKVHAES